MDPSEHSSLVADAQAKVPTGAPDRAQAWARWIFGTACVYGLLLLLPLLLWPAELAARFPPASNRPEQYMAFVGVALAWQVAFGVVAREPARLRPIMLPAVLEKWLSGGLVLSLWLQGRVDAMTVAPFVVDLVWGLLFLACWIRLRGGRA